MRVSRIGAYIAMPKSLIGEGVWVRGNRSNEFRMQWPITCEGIAEAEAPYIEAVHAADCPYLSYSISLLVPPPIFRLDIGEDLEHSYSAPLPGGRTTRRILQGHHVHTWEANRPRSGEALPQDLPVAEPYAGSLDFRAALMWFCDQVNIWVDEYSIPSLRQRETLL